MHAALIVPISSQRSRLHFGRRLLRQKHVSDRFYDLWRHLPDHHCSVNSTPLGVFTQVELTQRFWINLVIYLLAVGGLGFPVLFGMWPAAVIYALFVILTRK